MSNEALQVLVDTEIDIQQIRKRLEAVIQDHQAVIHFPRYTDYDRDLKYLLPSIDQWLRVVTPTRIFSFNDRSFMLCKHTTFDNVNDAHPQSQMKQIASTYDLSCKARQLPPFYTLSYHTEYGKSSFWNVSHLKDIITDRFFAHSIRLEVMMDMRKRRPQPVVPALKAVCDNNWLNEYPDELKHGKYREMKTTCSRHIKVLNALKTNQNKQLLFSCPIQLRYYDEDANKHLNDGAYTRYVYDAVLLFDKQVRQNQAFIFWMTNFYWKELTMSDYSHCYVNIWSVTTDDKNTKVYAGTIDIDETVCKRNKNGDVCLKTNLNNAQWKHYNGFAVGVKPVKGKSKL